jgi:hypothetical protein
MMIKIWVADEPAPYPPVEGKDIPREGQPFYINVADEKEAKSACEALGVREYTIELRFME